MNLFNQDVLQNQNEKEVKIRVLVQILFAHKNNSVEGLANYVTNKSLQRSNLIIVRHADDN